jgi:hypothetical protein
VLFAAAVYVVAMVLVVVVVPLLAPLVLVLGLLETRRLARRL